MSSPMGQYNQMASPKTWQSKSPRGYQSGFLQQMGPEQMGLMNQNIGMLGQDSYLGRLASGDQSQFEQMEAPAWQQFQQAQGQMASRFSGMGMGAQKSSGFKNSMGQMGSDFASQLQSKRMDYRRQALEDLMGFSNQLLGQRPYEQFMAQKGPSKFEKFMNYAAPIAQSAIKAGAGGF